MSAAVYSRGSARMNRRLAISALGGAALAFGQRLTPEVMAQRQKGRTRPSLCVYSGNLSKIPYPQLSEIVKDMGYDGIDLTIMKGGHIDPSKYMVDLDRAFQTFQDAGIEVPIVTTSFTSPSDTYAYAVLYVCGQIGGRFCRLGEWPPASDSSGQNSAMRAMVAHNSLAQFALTGAQCHITPLLANHAGSYPGRSIPEAEALLAGVGRTALGYCFDPAQAVIEARSGAGWEAALQAAMSRLGAVALSDVALPDSSSQSGDAQPKLCPLGEGVIDWKKFFAMLSAAGFRGPISLHMDYEARNPVSAMNKDLAFVRARVDEAWKV